MNTRWLKKVSHLLLRDSQDPQGIKTYDKVGYIEGKAMGCVRGDHKVTAFLSGYVTQKSLISGDTFDDKALHNSITQVLHTNVDVLLSPKENEKEKPFRIFVEN